MQLLALLIRDARVSVAAITPPIAVELISWTSRVVAGVLRYLMKPPQFLRKASALAVSLAALNIAHAQSPSSDDYGIEVNSSDGPWTVLTMAPDGSWGAATESMSNRAIANAIAECKFKYRAKIGCGGYQVAAKQAWILGIRCGNENILAVGRDLAEAERSAARRENELRRSYVPNMPACRRIVTIDSRGQIVVPTTLDISSK